MISAVGHNQQSIDEMCKEFEKQVKIGNR